MLPVTRPGGQFLSIAHPSGDTSSGRVNQKVEPRPGALSTPTCPWCCSMMVLAMANPGPILCLVRGAQALPLDKSAPTPAAAAPASTLAPVHAPALALYFPPPPGVPISPDRRART